MLTGFEEDSKGIHLRLVLIDLSGRMLGYDVHYWCQAIAKRLSAGTPNKDKAMRESRAQQGWGMLPSSSRAHFQITVQSWSRAGCTALCSISISPSRTLAADRAWRLAAASCPASGVRPSQSSVSKDSGWPGGTRHHWKMVFPVFSSVFLCKPSASCVGLYTPTQHAHQSTQLPVAPYLTSPSAGKSASAG